MDRWRWRLTDWRPWAFVAVVVAMTLADIVLPSQVLILPYLVIPLIGSAVLARPGFSLALLILALVLSTLSIAFRDYAVEDTVRRLIVLASAGGIAVVLAWLLRRNADRVAEATDRLQLLADNASDVVYLVDPDGAVSWMSPSVTSELGYQPEELVGRRMFDLINPEDRDGIANRRTDVLSGESVGIAEGTMAARFRRKDGSYTWMSVRTTAFHEPDGSLLRAVCGLHSIDDVVRERENHAEAATTLRTTIDAVSDPIIVLDLELDEGGEIVAIDLVICNAAAFTDLGVPPDTPAGTHFAGVLGPGEDAAVRAVLNLALTTTDPVIFDDHPTDRAVDKRRHFYDVRAQRIGSRRVCVTWRDMTSRHEESRALAASEETFRLLAANSTAVSLLALEGVLTWMSPSLTSQLGWLPEEWIGRRFEDFTHPDDVGLATGRREEINAGATRVTTLRMRDSAGGYHWVEVHAGPFYDAGGEQVGISGSFRIVDSEVAALSDLERRARYDAVTGALLREEAFAHLSGIPDQGLGTGGTAVLFCDLDGFKSVNDTFGHSSGDIVLREVVQRARAALRSEDVVVRMGGDEFLIILKGVGGPDEARAIADKVRRAIKSPILVSGGAALVGVSIGVTMARPHEDDAVLIARADAAMYRAKQDGRDRVVVDVSDG